MTFSLVALAVAPGLALFLFFYLRSRYKQMPLRPLVITFIYGAVALAPSMMNSLALQRLTGWRSSTPNVLHSLLGALFIVGLVEEGCKFLVVRFYSYRLPGFTEPYDGIMYSISAALGFATVENILYVISGGPTTGVLRAVLSVPSHAFNAVLMGCLLGEAKFARSDAAANRLSVLGLVLAIVAHGIYNFIVFSLDKAPLLVFLLVLYAVLSWIIILIATRRQAEQSAHKHPQLVDLHQQSARDAARVRLEGSECVLPNAGRDGDAKPAASGPPDDAG
ncbi:PrsW family intramembrane metalloprotease [candidate division WOR-3 bacterium]|nr:PrsW family intramembrane metalloprotease [candidate division WOR-3 bacterium]